MESIFKALADPSRLKLLDSLKRRDGQTLQELEGQLDMTRFGVMKHLGVLEEAGLIVTRKVGRFKHHYLNALPLQEAIDRWIDPYRVKSAARSTLDLKSKLEGNEAMKDTMTKPDFMMQTHIRCSPNALWEALTDPDQMSAYHFIGGGVRKDGNAYSYLDPEGSTVMQSRVIKLDPKTRIEATFEPRSASIPVSRTVFLLIPEGEHVKLVIEHYDLHFPLVPGEGVADGWPRWAAGLKTWLETGEAVRFTEVAAAPAS